MMKSVFLVCVVMCVLHKEACCLSEYDRIRGEPDLTDELEYCSGSNQIHCGQPRSEQIQKQYRGLFWTDEEISERLKQKYDSNKMEAFNETDGSDSLVGDGDSCCATVLTYTKNETLVDIYGKTRTVVHDPPNYQYVPSVTCRPNGCTGTCLIEPTYFNVLVYEDGETEGDDTTFVWFALPGYCSCKNIS